MAEESDLEKTEQPSQRRLDQAREEGQVARSRELSTFATLLAGGLGLWLMGSTLTRQMLKLVQDGLTLDAETAFQPALLLSRLYSLSLDMLLALLPLLLLLVVTALFCPLLLNGWLFSLKPLQPAWSRLDPVAGIRRMVSSHGWVELAKAVAKTLVVGGASAWTMWQHRDDVMQLIAQPVAVAVPYFGTLLWDSFLATMAGMLLIVMMDVPFQLWSHHKKLRMTKEEVRQEAKEAEGNPQVRARIRSLQREMARKRMMAEIPTADVVVTNPTHYAVALRYRDKGMRAPVVVAKGAHLLAGRLREIAMEHGVPVLEAPPLARALYRHVDLGQGIPEALYTAVAEVLAYVYQLRRYEQVGGSRPELPQELPVPSHLDPGIGAHEEANEVGER
jgi:flagellar biosynthetic protein FlhB